MTCLQEILLRLAMAVEALRQERVADADQHIQAVYEHLRSHGAVPGAELTNCEYEVTNGRV